MATPTNIFQSLSQHMLGQGQLKIDQASSQQKQQQLDMQKRQDFQANQQADQAFNEHMNSIGALSVHPGSNAVNDTQIVPTGIGTGVTPVSFTRPADPDRIINYTTAEGHKIQYELPTPEKQSLHQSLLKNMAFQADAPTRQGQVQNEQDLARAKALGTGQGNADTEKYNLDNFGRTVDAQYATDNRLPASMIGTKVLPQSFFDLSKSTVPADTRGQAEVDAANARAASAEKRNQDRIDAQADLETQKETARAAAQKANTDLRTQLDATRRANPTANANSASARQRTSQEEADFNRHQGMENTIADLAQKRIELQSTLDNVKNTEEFFNPVFNRKDMMSDGARGVISSQIRGLQDKINTQRIMQTAIRRKRGWGEFAPDAGQSGGAQPGNSQPGGAQPGNGSQAPPASGRTGVASNAGATGAAVPNAGGSNSGGQTKVVTKDQVAAAAKKLGVDVGSATQKYQSLGYTIR